MKTWKFVLGVICASPITILAFLFYVLPFGIMKWYKYVGWRELAFVWRLNENCPVWLNSKWKHWSGAAIGNIIIIKSLPEENLSAKITFQHELIHVKQCMILGLLQPLTYSLCWLCGTILKKSIGHTDGYFDSIFEIHARRCVGQVIDVIGITEKIQQFKK